MFKSKLACALGALLTTIAGPVVAAEPIKIGFITELSGPSGIIGDELANAFKLALSEMGGTLGGRPVQVIYADDEAKPDLARQLSDKMIESDHVQLLTGMNLSNMLLAIAKPALDAGVFVVSNNAGPSQLAGKQCHPHFFAASHQNDTLFEGVGMYMQEKGVPKTFLLAPNYPAGRDMLNGFRKAYKGEILGEIYTTLNALDYAGTLSEIRAKNPPTVMFFYPGGMGINFVKQYAQSGLGQQTPLYTGPGSVDQTTLPAIGDGAIGVISVTNWSEDLDNPTSRRFTQSFTKTYGRIPSPFAAVSYDTARMLDAALKTIDGRIEDKPAFQKALENVKFDSVRGSFSFNKNHFPIQNLYSTVVVKGADGKLASKLTGIVVRDIKDSYADECKMTQ